MSRCPYCRHELPGLETICQKCFEAGYEQVVHPKPWWQRRQLSYRPRFRRGLVYGFLFMFAGVFLRLRLDAWISSYHHRTIRDSAVLALVFAAITILVESTRKADSKDSEQKKSAGKDPAP